MVERCRVSQSKAKTYRQCSQAYFYKYVEKLRRKKIKRPFMFGRIVHEMLEAEANGRDPFEVLAEIAATDEKLFASEREMYGEILEDVGDIMDAYFEYWDDKELKYIKVKGKKAEHDFELEVGDQLLINGKIDAYAQTKNRLKWLTENKTFKQALNDDHRWRDLQSSVYLRVNQLLGWVSVDGMLWNYVRSKAPTRPQLLKAGGLSVKRIDTLPAVVLQTIRQHKLKKKDYPELLEAAEANMASFFNRVYTPINEDVVGVLWDDFIATGNEIADTHGKPGIRNIGRHCMWCDYEPLCRAVMTGSDEDYLKEREYRKDEKPQDLKDREAA